MAIVKSKQAEMTHMAELRVVMASTSTHDGPAFHYKAKIDIAILTVAISVPYY